MNSESLYTFVKMAKYQNYRKVAEQCYITPTTAFNQIKNLESSLGAKLFDRIGNRVVLSSKGKEFLPYALEILGLFEQSAARLSSNSRRQLSVLTSSYVASSLMPKFLETIYFDSHPDIDISVYLNDKEIPLLITEGLYDIGIDRKPPQSDSVKYKEVCEGKIRLIVPNIAETQNINSESHYFSKYRIISGNHPTYWNTLCKKIYNVCPHATLTSIESVDATKKLILQDKAVSYLPLYIFSDLPPDSPFRVIEPKELEPVVAFTYVLWKRDDPDIHEFTNLFELFTRKEQI